MVYNRFHAGVLELADEVDSKSIGSNTVRVQVPPPAPNSKNPNPVPIGTGFGFLTYLKLIICKAVVYVSFLSAHSEYEKSSEFCLMQNRSLLHNEPTVCDRLSAKVSAIKLGRRLPA